MFHTNLRIMREAHGYSQKAFADMLRIPVTTYRNYENTLREPSYDILVKISKLLNISTDELLGVNEPQDKYSELFFYVQQLPGNKLEMLKAFAKFLSEYK